LQQKPIAKAAFPPGSEQRLEDGRAVGLACVLVEQPSRCAGALSDGEELRHWWTSFPGWNADGELDSDTPLILSPFELPRMEKAFVGLL
jgi:hypothetical protein